MKTRTLEDVMNLAPLSEQEMNDVLNFENKDFSDCPKQTPEDLAKFKPLKEVRPNLYNELVELYKSTNKGK